jgi:hypothetical protein
MSFEQQPDSYRRNWGEVKMHVAPGVEFTLLDLITAA